MKKKKNTCKHVEVFLSPCFRGLHCSSPGPSLSLWGGCAGYSPLSYWQHIRDCGLGEWRNKIAASTRLAIQGSEAKLSCHKRKNLLSLGGGHSKPSILVSAATVWTFAFAFHLGFPYKAILDLPMPKERVGQIQRI